MSHHHSHEHHEHAHEYHDHIPQNKKNFGIQFYRHYRLYDH